MKAIAHAFLTQKMTSSAMLIAWESCDMLMMMDAYFQAVKVGHASKYLRGVSETEFEASLSKFAVGGMYFNTNMQEWIQRSLNFQNSVENEDEGAGLSRRFDKAMRRIADVFDPKLTDKTYIDTGELSYMRIPLFFSSAESLVATRKGNSDKYLTQAPDSNPNLTYAYTHYRYYTTQCKHFVSVLDIPTDKTKYVCDMWNNLWREDVFEGCEEFIKINLERLLVYGSELSDTRSNILSVAQNLNNANLVDHMLKAHTTMQVSLYFVAIVCAEKCGRYVSVYASNQSVLRYWDAQYALCDAKNKKTFLDEIQYVATFARLNMFNYFCRFAAEINDAVENEMNASEEQKQQRLILGTLLHSHFVQSHMLPSLRSTVQMAINRTDAQVRNIFESIFETLNQIKKDECRTIFVSELYKNTLKANMRVQYDTLSESFINATSTIGPFAFRAFAFFVHFI
ncbi:hypothetical protein CYMTET_28967 [Cymbomonas tetramitiformis]|uniref:Uncharacterized protein n=1 Tax=Cymbomonas tetramitiformis TaxID=36881 RepID=A0AAE0FLS1_9CHLO|nr:hypothetical protein CYMTET_28967 [Cymbomonas tetramitiformis]